MKNFIFVLASAATLAVVVPATAQVRVEASPGGVEVGVGHDRDGERRIHHRGWRGAYAKDCRTEQTQVTTPSGRVIAKTKRICD